MGEILAMKSWQLKPLALMLALSACGQGGGLIGGVMAKMTGVRAATNTVSAAGNQTVWVTMPAAGIKFSMAHIETDGPTTIWASQDGSQMSLRDGMFVSTRGFGMDLMSAEAPSMQTVLSGAPHRRVYHLLDGADQPQRLEFSCTAATAPAEKSDQGMKHIVETCKGAAGTISNDFWLAGNGHAAKSRQWVSPMVGHLILGGDEG